jgi:murein L,D-transpeptidase YcbB/YkuD
VNFLTQDDTRIDDMKIQQKLDSLKTSYFVIKKNIPIIITYYTSWVDDNGIVHFADDVYHRNDPNYVQATPEEEALLEEEQHSQKSHLAENYDRYDPYNATDSTRDDNTRDY